MAAFDDDLETLVRAQEEETGEEAPYFGAETKREALQLAAWKSIGEEWHDRAPETCWTAYTSRYPVGGANQVRYSEAAKAAIRSGKRDEELKRAAAVCDDAASLAIIK